ncbi:MAG: hypothetical protein Q8R67_02490 [Rhodoferax sp.]|nr:hypothetical protein [Rhodoferax sp.]MDP3650529.1 hypothetical protein [Rhodoferax sp.]
MSTLRTAIVAEALTWLETPFHHQARLKGCGVDCANLLAGVFAAVGLVPAIALDAYPQDWHIHNAEPRFLRELSLYADPLPTGAQALPGDIAMFQYGRHAAHGAIVTNWPQVIHAWKDQGRVVLTEADSGPLAGRFAGLWRVRGVA